MSPTCCDAVVSGVLFPDTLLACATQENAIEGHDITSKPFGNVVHVPGCNERYTTCIQTVERTCSTWAMQAKRDLDEWEWVMWNRLACEHYNCWWGAQSPAARAQCDAAHSADLVDYNHQLIETKRAISTGYEQCLTNGEAKPFTLYGAFEACSIRWDPPLPVR